MAFHIVQFFRQPSLSSNDYCALVQLANDQKDLYES